MEQIPVPSRPRPPVLALAVGVLGLVGAALTAVMSFLVATLGGLDGDGRGEWWVLALVAASVAQAWGAVRLLRRRGWLLLALASLPGMLPLLALAGLWSEYRQTPSPLELVAAAPVLTLALTLLPPVRSWATARSLPAGSDHGALTTSGA